MTEPSAPKIDKRGNGKGWTTDFESNKKFYEFYQNIIKKDDFEKFKKIIKEKLPVSFRISFNSYLKNQIKNLIDKNVTEINKNLKEMDENAEKTENGLEGKDIQIIKQLIWYPDAHAWQVDVSKREIKKSAEYKKFYDILFNETFFGSISRQETVSMIPPILVDIQPYHTILDMCASPGSKTSQILERLYAKDFNPDGFIVANDMDVNRCSVLVTQLKRIKCSSFIVTCQDARMFPSLYSFDESKNQKNPFLFDRVLCDVPCSGDGTIRKNPDIYPKWKFGTGYNLHFMQKDILKRGLQLLKVGGILIYSTCSLNPAENESVILSTLRENEDKIEIVDCSSSIKGLEYEPGLPDWKFINELKYDYKRGPLPTPQENEYEKYGLKNCIRIYPYLQNTGGFFITALKKIGDIDQVFESENLPAKRKYISNKAPKHKYSTQNFITFLNDKDSQWTEINEFFKPEGLKYENLIVRSENEAKNTIYFINDRIRDFIQCNQDNLRIIASGAKIFARSSFQKHMLKCNFRIMQESIFEFMNFFKNRLVNASQKDLELLLFKGQVKREEISCHEVLSNYEQGSMIFRGDSEETKDTIIVGHLSKNYVRLMLKKQDRIHFLLLLGFDYNTASTIDEMKETEKIE